MVMVQEEKRTEDALPPQRYTATIYYDDQYGNLNVDKVAAQPLKQLLAYLKCFSETFIEAYVTTIIIQEVD